ncbi:hypothetical protein GGR02_002209 [Anoxybacillus voinovskiensis]|uniref:Transcriptional coactivator p15 (PC4) C-terminal domain-containing protein n=1 Tax=Anoxybacteroides voinovskiense TaxID=230470 RepID=A0A840DSA3_9BACL|nr:hypothetical protein [Anoxybacillus voinovskiensis]GGJ79406.1 hypothetical protein GCM10008982_30990 [Anoxybacillus voinovskiensis]
MSKIQFEIKQKIAVLSESTKGWSKELNLISWNGYPAKFDIRDWDAAHEKMGKGVTLTEAELKALYHALQRWFEGENEGQVVSWHEPLERWAQHSPLFIQQLKNILLYLQERQYPLEKQRQLLYATVFPEFEEALRYEIETIRSIHEVEYAEFVQLLRTLKPEQVEQFFVTLKQ